MKRFLLIQLFLLRLVLVHAQDTFSIVAVDSATGEVGSAGATCLQAPNPPQGALIISDVIPGVGAMHTQALWRSFNQQTGHTYMSAVYMPEAIIYEVNLSDIDADSTIRQYGVAIFDANGRPHAAAYTGVNCFDYKGHNTGSYYAIQGNIITDHSLLDSMESRFLNTPGNLADKLMAALQGANIPGADTRCLPEGVPSQSAFLRVAKPTDHADTLHLHLVVKSRPYGMSPIDSLQTLYDEWKSAQPNSINETTEPVWKIFPNPASHNVRIQQTGNSELLIRLTDITGRVIIKKSCSGSCQLNLAGVQDGVYLVHAGSALRKLVVRR